MPQVQTVRGPVDTADFGQVLVHEHVFVLNADIQQNYPQEWGSEEARVADAVHTPIHEEVLPYVREHGVPEEQIRTMLVDNPRRYFENVGRY
jgi:predicted metal-dependent phosphotriesterase family hydrolase